MDDATRTALTEDVSGWIAELCSASRAVGEPGNAAANELFARVVEAAGFELDSARFDCDVWRHGPSWVAADGARIDIQPGPYSLPARLTAPVRTASTLAELADPALRGAIVLVTGDLASGQLAPLGYPFYTNEKHAEIARALIAVEPAAILAATDRDAGLAGGASPFPWIEDGAFPIPSAYLHVDDAGPIAAMAGRDADIVIDSQRVATRADQLWATRAGRDRARLLVTGHIDAKYGTPGALDNAAGVATLMAVARLLGDIEPALSVELAPFNGEDHWAAHGELAWLAKDAADDSAAIALVVNVDAAGHVGNEVAISRYGLDDAASARIDALVERFDGIVAGEPWYQSDHMIFAMRGLPALAATSSDIDLVFGLTHTERDAPVIVDASALVQLAEFIAELATDGL